MANVPPYIFNKHIYARASIAGAILLCFLLPYANQYFAMLTAASFIVVIRLLSYVFDWSVPIVQRHEK